MRPRLAVGLGVWLSMLWMAVTVDGQEAPMRDVPTVLPWNQVHGEWADAAAVADHRVVA